jgi:hypothetical protein
LSSGIPSRASAQEAEFKDLERPLASGKWSPLKSDCEDFWIIGTSDDRGKIEVHDGAKG